jgi:hypothetical protein
MSFVYTPFKQALFEGKVNLRSCTMKVMLVMTNTTADTDQDAKDFTQVTTLDEFDGSGYTVGGSAVASQVVAEDDPNNRSEFSANALTFATLGAGTRQIQGAVLYGCSGGAISTGKSLLFAFVDTGGFPISANGGDITITWNAEGILQAT